MKILAINSNLSSPIRSQSSFGEIFDKKIIQEILTEDIFKMQDNKEHIEAIRKISNRYNPNYKALNKARKEITFQYPELRKATSNELAGKINIEI